MKDLIDAAKAVVDWWEDKDPSDLPIERLIAAVERADKPPADFESWYDENIEGCFDVGIYDSTKSAWVAAQQAERERIKKILGEWVGGELMEKIDAA